MEYKDMGHGHDDTNHTILLKKMASTWKDMPLNNDPAEADKFVRIQRDLDETKIILHKTIDSVLQHGEKLDSLVEESSDLSATSQKIKKKQKTLENNTGCLFDGQMFFKQAKKTNQCCNVT
ncbi:VAMP-like protein YKT61 [Acorus gramineus]|uniref:VAMP-like protein YKT61 n=1 Tax=Acorus gramineus TaxID=55184 RepID=A0AAV9BS88_ACOGR|nr:VAMP-like protein YKT61 [Acorus gramineus]